MFKALLSDGGPSVARFINIGVFFVYSAALLKLSWGMSAIDMGMWSWAFYFSFLIYGSGNSNISKWLDVLKTRAGFQTDSKEITKDKGAKDV